MYHAWKHFYQIFKFLKTKMWQTDIAVTSLRCVPFWGRRHMSDKRAGGKKAAWCDQTDTPLSFLSNKSFLYQEKEHLVLFKPLKHASGTEETAAGNRN